MLVRPGGVAARAANDFKNGVRPNSLMGEEWNALVQCVYVPRESARIYNVLRNGWIADVLVDGLIEDHGVAGAVGARRIGRIKNGAVVADVIEQAGANGRAPRHESHKARKGV